MKEKKMQAKDGSMVNVHYKGTLRDGTEFDNSHVRGQTLSFQLGSGRMIRGFNDAVVGMTIGQTKKVTLSPLEAYGPRIPEAQQIVPREAFKNVDNFEIGAMVQGNGPGGTFLAKIIELQEESVVLDLNHPLAGEDLTFEIELVSIDENVEP